MKTETDREAMKAAAEELLKAMRAARVNAIAPLSPGLRAAASRDRARYGGYAPKVGGPKFTANW